MDKRGGVVHRMNLYHLYQPVTVSDQGGSFTVQARSQEYHIPRGTVYSYNRLPQDEVFQYRLSLRVSTAHGLTWRKGEEPIE